MSGTLYFFGCLALLLLGYAIYGVFVEKVFKIDPKRLTPVSTKADGMDYVVLPGWKIFFIQLLNIAGLGPVFGPIVGALYGPAALLWVVFGCIFAGAVHDFIAGMISLRYGGASYPEVIGRNLGKKIRSFMEGYTILFLILVGAVFVTGPAALLTSMTDIPLGIWSAIIFAYYICATIMPIDVIIGRVYPFFAVLLLFMAFGLIGAMLATGMPILPHVDFQSFAASTHPEGLPIWPGLFIVIACGAISGFHATQSPMMARCMVNEKQGRKFFYGAMIAEGVIGLIWVTLGMAFYEYIGEHMNPAVVVNHISNELLGSFGAVLAVLGVVVLPVTSGDTAFRSARLTIADALKFDQRPNSKRLALAVPLFVVGVALNFIDFNILWRYFGWANQTLAAIMLWAGAAYLLHRNKFHWIATIPAMFMTAVSGAYICYEKTMGFGLNLQISTAVGIVLAVALTLLLLTKGRNPLPDEPANC